MSISKYPATRWPTGLDMAHPAVHDNAGQRDCRYDSVAPLPPSDEARGAMFALKESAARLLDPEPLDVNQGNNI